MIPLSSIITTFETEFLAQYGDELLPGQRRALTAMKHCHTALSPRMQAQCVACEQQRFVPHSCGHRAYPHCQHHEMPAMAGASAQTTAPRWLLPADLHPPGRAQGVGLTPSAHAL